MNTRRSVAGFSRLMCLFLICAASVSEVSGQDPAPPASGKTIILQDLYHHLPPSGNRGSYESSLGRYTWYDRMHPNGFSSLRTELLRKGFEVRSTTNPIRSDTLQGVDIFMIVHPDSKAYLAKPNFITPEDVATIVNFVKAGGSLVVITNSYGDPAWPTEDFDLEHTNLLAKEFGLRLNGDQTGHVNFPILAGDPFLKPGWIFHYGNGCTLQALPNAPAKVDVVVKYQGKPIVVLSQLGKGKALFIGDSGSWGNGNLYRPDVNNRQIAVQLFKLVAPKRHRAALVGGEAIQLGKRADRELKYALQVEENVNSIKTFSLLNKLNPNMKRRILTNYLDEDAQFDIRLALGERTAERGPGKPWEARISSGLGELLASLRAALPGTLAPGAEWTSEIPLRILPLDESQKPLERKVTGTFHFRGTSGVGETQVAKIYVSAYLDLKGLPITAFVSPQEMELVKAEQISVVGGQENCEASFTVRFSDGVLLDGEINTNSTFWLKSAQSVDTLHVGLGDMVPTFISESVRFRLAP